jgi:plastocyanin
MRRRFATLAGLGALLSATVLWLVAAPGVSAGDPCYHDYQIPPTTSSAASVVTFEPCAFAPTLTSVPVGTTVTFKNGSQFTHLLTGANQAWGSRDAEVAPGATVSHAFAKAGVYPYACALHRGMSGVIVVGDAAAIGAAGAGTTSGTTTGSTTTSTTGQTARTTATADPLPVVLLAVVAGIVVGAVGGWLASRRRTIREGSAASPAA